MIIGIDGNEANVKKRVGVGQYAFELLQQFAETKSPNVTFRIYLKTEPLGDLPKKNRNWQYRVIGPGKLWTQWRLPLDLYITKPRPDVFFTPSHYAPRFSPAPTVVSIMDLAYIHFPQLFNSKDLSQLRNWTKYSVKNAKKILTISKSSKNDIIQEYGKAANDVIVTYPGARDSSTLTPVIYGMNQLKTKYNIVGDFILFVGTLQPRKNITRLIEAFAEVLKDETLKDLELVIVGKKGWLFDEILEAPKKIGVDKKVKFLDSVSDEELNIFYKHALCFVLPSLYEGFGLPVLEAMKAGCPVITSNISSLPEVGGDACLYVDPENVKDIADKIKELTTNEKLRKELIEKGKKQVVKFSWETTAKQTLEVLEELGGTHER